MKKPDRILVVDDTPQNVKLLADLLAVKGYEVATAASGSEALEKVESYRPDLVLLDVMMPGMNGYEVCRKIRENPGTAILPVVMVTALDPAQERIKGLEAGADDFLGKPVNQPELLARVRSLLRIKELYDTVQGQAAQLAEWNTRLEKRVAEQVGELERMKQLKRFLAPHIAEAILAAGADDPLKTHRREVTVVFLDLRGFTSFAETAEPEEVLSVLQEYHDGMGQLIVEYEGTVEHFAGDGIMIVFNDPVPIPNPPERAVRMVVAMRERVAALTREWRKRGYNLDCGFGIATGYATIGAIGYEGRREYTAIGTVINLAARLCAEAGGGQILIARKTFGSIEGLVEAEPLEPLTLKGFSSPVSAFSVTKLKN